MPDWDDLRKLLDDGVRAGVAPAMVFLAWAQGRPRALMAAGQATTETIFDLASLTKPLATAPLCLDMQARGRLPWSEPLGELLGSAVPADKAGITIERLLTHSAGYPAYQPYYQALEREAPLKRRGLLLAMLMNEPLAHEPGAKALYSDLGYLLLGLILERAGRQPLDQAVNQIYTALGVEGPRYLPLGGQTPPLEDIAPCGPLPGRPVVHGQVEDENAFSLGGLAGQAGLFGTATQVAAVMDALCRAAQDQGPWPVEEAVRLFAVDQTTPGSSRTPGFDTPSGSGSQAGPNAPSGVVGHLGFTGVSVWWRPAVNRGLVLLTNRVAHGRANDKIKEFRRLVHQMAWPLLGS